MSTALAQTQETPAVSRGAGRRILLLSTNIGLAGGAEEQVMQLALALDRRGWMVTVVSMLRIGELARQLSSSGIPVLSLEMRKGIPDPRAVLRLKAIVDRFRPDVVHSHMTHANLLARIGRPLCRIPVLICTLHGLQMNRVSGGSTRLRELAHWMTDRCADLTTTVCQAAADLCVENGSVPQAKVLALPNGVNTRVFRPDAAARARVRQSLSIGDEFVWLAAGRLEPAKDYATMLDAFARLRARGDRSILLICGTGSLEGELREQMRTLGLASSVRLLGFRRDMSDLMTAADGYAMSSCTEGLPLVLLQASAAGLPVVATNVGGNAEIVVHEKTGYLAPARDPEALSAAMLNVLALPHATRMAMGSAARARTEAHFSEERIVDRWEDLYLRLRAGTGARSTAPNHGGRSPLGNRETVRVAESFEGERTAAGRRASHG